MTKNKENFLVHLALNGLFEMFVIPEVYGTKMQFYPYPDTKENFESYLVKRFGHLGKPESCNLIEDISCYEVKFPGLHFKDPEEALTALS